VILAALKIHNRTQSNCVSNDGFCPGWIADNWNRYTHPFWQHVYLTVIALAIVFAVLYIAYSIYMDQRSSDNVNHSAHLWGAAYEFLSGSLDCYRMIIERPVFPAGPEVAGDVDG